MIDVVGTATARQVVGGAVQSLQNRPDRDRAPEPLGQLVADIAGIQIRKDQHVGATVDLRVGNLSGRLAS